MSVKTKRALWLGSAISIAFASFASVAAADETDNSVTRIKITEGVQIAQAATTPPPPPPAAAEEEKPEEKKVERVVVTGSRLKKNEFTSSSPVQIITRESSTLEGLTDSSDILQSATVASGSSQIDNTLTGFIGFGGGAGANTISLRGLGAERTLVLLNGRRIGPAGIGGFIGPVDLNTLPGSIVDRFEILKDGGSSVYGSDAVGGVVNVITRQNIEGGFLSGNTTQTFEGGGESYTVDGYWGETFDRGHYSISGEYHKREPLTRGDREYLSCAQDLNTVYATGAPLDIIDPATGKSKCFNVLVGFVNPGTGGVHIPSPGLVAGGGYLPTLVPAIAGSLPDVANYRRVGHSFAQVNTFINNLCANAVHAAANAFCASPATIAAEKERRWRATLGDQPNDHPRFAENTVISPAERYSIFVQGGYDVLPGMEAYTELFFNRRESSQLLVHQLVPTIAAGHPFNPFPIATRPFIVRETPSSQTVDFYRALVGVRGDFSEAFPIFGGWSYDLFGQHTRSEGEYKQRFVYSDRIAATSVAAGCNPALITQSNFPGIGCPTINWFRPDTVINGNFSPTEEAFLFGQAVGHTTYTQTTINGSVTGDLFQLPYGSVSAALGFEYREDEIDDTPDRQAQVQNVFGFATAGRTAGSDRVREVFGEVSVPLLNGLSFAEDLTVNGSARYTDYDSYGEDSTYKLGLNWQITPEYRLRATTGTSFRAPALFEIFLANQVAFQTQVNLDGAACFNWNTSANANLVNTCGPAGLNLPIDYNAPGAGSATILIGGGGPGVLSAETSESRTLGFIWTPDWIDFSAAVDYWEIEVNNQVARFGSNNIVFSCQNKVPLGSSEFCALVTRNLTGTPCAVLVPAPAPVGCNVAYGNILQVKDSFVNLNAQISDGLDLTVRYEHEFSFGKFRLDGQVTWTFTDETQIFVGSVLDDQNGEVNEPDMTARLNARFDHEDWTFTWNTDIIARSSNDEEFGGAVFSWRGFTPANNAAYYKQFAEFTATHDASVRYRTDDWTFLAGVTNIFDEHPPTISQLSGSRLGNAAVLAGQYDILGRGGFLTISKEF